MLFCVSFSLRSLCNSHVAATTDMRRVPWQVLSIEEPAMLHCKG